VLGVLATIVLASAEVAHAGFGISPPYVKNTRLTQGSTYTQTITIVRGDAVDDLRAEVTYNMPGFSDWVTIDRGTEFVLPKGQQQVPIQVTVTVPEDAEFDTYRGSMRIRTIPADPSSGVSIALGAQIDVEIRVVDQIRDFTVQRVELSETEEPRRRWWLTFPGKTRFAMNIENTGNAPVAPTTVSFDVYDKRGSVLLSSVESTNRMELVDPFELRRVVAELPNWLPPSGYLVRYEIFLEDELKRSGELTLSVLPEGTLEGYSGYGFTGLSLRDKLTLILPPVVLLVLLIVGLGVLRFVARGRRRPPQDETPPPPPPGHAPPRAPHPYRGAHQPQGPPGHAPPRPPVRRPAPPRPPQPPHGAPPRPQPPSDVVDLSRRRGQR
jgi:hypothetical protein